MDTATQCFKIVMINLEFAPTTDKLIRTALKEELGKTHKEDPEARIIEEMGITHGAARVDVAVVNGSIHGYELKSDLDTLRRLPDQMEIYNSVLDQVTLVVGKQHLHEAINAVPDWWGITIAKVAVLGGVVSFCHIRESGNNPHQDSAAIASLLWRDEALELLKEAGHAEGVRSKPRKVLYERLAEVMDQTTLRAKVRERLSARTTWRLGTLCMQGGD
jgi:hypothetical protein